MNDLKKYEGNIVNIVGTVYRVVHVGDDLITLCKLNEYEKLELLFIANLHFEEYEKDKQIEVIKEEKSIINIDYLSDNQKQKYKNYLSIMNELLNEYDQSLVLYKIKNHKRLVEQLSNKYDISARQIRRKFIEYIKSGKSFTSLLDKRIINHSRKTKITYKKKPGRPFKDGVQEGIILTEKQFKEFDNIIKDFKKGHQLTIVEAYGNLINKYYSKYSTVTQKLEWLPASKRPTLNQFRNYIHKVMTKKDFEIQKTSAREFENNKRLLLSSSRANVFKPGQIQEIDALEMDISITSSINPENCVGRPICYFMVDVLTSVITSFSVSYENNSIIGLTNVMTNMVDDKLELCSKYNIDINPDDWPSNFIPNEIRIDRGADFRSDKFTKMCCDLGITINLLPTAMGSLKGHVEQSFRQFQSTFRNKLEQFGLITTRYDSNHHRESMLSLEGVRKMIIAYIVYHNTHVHEGYKMSKEMLELPNFIPTPANLWNYFVNKMGAPKPINDTNKNEYLFNFLLPVNASLTRMGIKYRRLFYLSNDKELLQEMYSIENKKVKFEVRYDPRSVNHLYYMRKGKLYITYLNKDIPNNLDFKDMTWKEYSEYLDKINKIKREGEKQNIENKAKLRTTYDEVIISDYKDTLSNDENIRENRAIERNSVNSKESLINKIYPTINSPEDGKEKNNNQNEYSDNNSNNQNDFKELDDADQALMDALFNFY